MKLTAKIKHLFTSENGDCIESFTFTNYNHKEQLQSLDSEKTYSIEIKEIKSKRSIEQNRYLWSLIHEIDKSMNGERSNDEWSVYVNLLERCGAKCDYVGALEITEPLLKENFRAIKRIKKIDLNGVEGYMYKVYLGSSKMDTKEMSMLIDTALDMASELNIDVEYWRDVLK